jgi:hypothetical protein
MKQLLRIVLLFIFYCCSEKTEQRSYNSQLVNLKDTTIKLIDSLGLLSFQVSQDFDTFFNWTHNSDCRKPCNLEKYRFQPKAFPVFKESGFIYNNVPDSLYQVTISHSGYFPFTNSDTSEIFSYHNQSRRDLRNDPATYKLKSDTLEKINDRYFSIIVVDLFDTAQHQYAKKILGATTIRSNIIKIYFELLTRHNDSINKNFIQNSLRQLRSVRLSNSE